MITLFSHVPGPNGWKVAIVLEELNIPYETKFLDMMKGEFKAPEYTKYNPNGRIPTIIDHENGDFVLWESIAIINYLAEQYDKEDKLHYSSGKEKHLVNQWLAFQASGQGPYFGQAAWFANFHQEKIPSAVTRYQNEIERVVGVLDEVLSKQPYLVGDKLTVADLSFIAWNDLLPWLLQGAPNDIQKYKHFKRWHDELTARPAVKKILDQKKKAMGM